MTIASVEPVEHVGEAVTDTVDNEPMPAADPFATWFRGLVESDETALEAVFRAAYHALAAYAGGITLDSAAANDVVQEAFVKIWERRSEHDPRGSLKALLYRTVRNLSLNHVRDTRNRERLLAARSVEEVRRAPQPDEVADGEELGSRLSEWLDELPERQREALVLTRFEGLSHEEVAQIMDIAPRTVNNHLVKALRHMRDRMAAYEPSLLLSR